MSRPTPPALSRLKLINEAVKLWEMSAAQKGAYLDFFGRADKDGDGFVGGMEAQQFFSSSRLDSNTLARIWQLADIDQDNQLNHEEFAIAMHLVFCVRDKQQALPAALPHILDYSLALSLRRDPFHGLESPKREAMLTPTHHERNGGVKAEQSGGVKEELTRSPRQSHKRMPSSQQEQARKKAVEVEEAEVAVARRRREMEAEVEAEAARRQREEEEDLARRRKEQEQELVRQRKEQEEAERVAAAEQRELEELWEMVDKEQRKEQELFEELERLSASAATFTVELAEVERATEVADAELSAVTTALTQCADEQEVVKDQHKEATERLDDLDEQDRSECTAHTDTRGHTQRHALAHKYLHTCHTHIYTHAYTCTHMHTHTRTLTHARTQGDPGTCRGRATGVVGGPSLERGEPAVPGEGQRGHLAVQDAAGAHAG
jgi:epidermal growth factor receptor substrate 15